MRSAIHMPAFVTAPTECAKCGKTLPAEAAFCLHCGALQPAAEISRPSLVSLTTGTILAALLGIACLVGALVTGALMPQQNYLDWQAVQAWRIEWLLAGIAFFVLACFLALVRRR